MKKPIAQLIGKSNYKAKCPECGSKDTDFHISRSPYAKHAFLCFNCRYVLQW